MRTSQAGQNLIKEFEGLRLNAYRCPAGVLTIGYGHTSAAGPPTVTSTMKISQAEAEQMLANDLLRYEVAVEKAVIVPLTQNQFDALVSFAYNCGIGALQKSTLLKRLNRGEYDAVPAELMKWNKAGGKELAGLTRRRRAEAKMWRGIDSRAPVPVEEARTAPDSPKPKKKITQSREANAAAGIAGTATVTAVIEAAPHVQTLTDALGRPVVIVLLVIAAAALAIWWFRKQRLEETGE